MLSLYHLMESTYSDWPTVYSHTMVMVCPNMACSGNVTCVICSASTLTVKRMKENTREREKLTLANLFHIFRSGTSPWKKFAFLDIVTTFWCIVWFGFLDTTLNNTVSLCIRDLDKLNLIWRFDFRHEPIFTTTTTLAALEKHFFKKRSKIISLLLFQG